MPAPGRTPGSVSIDESGVRIRSQKNGAPVQVVIDADGIRVEDGTKAPPPPPDDPAAVVIDRNGAVVIPPEAATDPAKVEQALESARREIESIVSDQVRRSVAHEVRTYRERSGDWMMSFALLLILTGIIVKVVLGGKKRAERRAQVATATAAEEGLKRQLVEAQLKTMQAQVEPHFLFNTLASVDYLIETDPATASKMQKNLIQYLRSALPQMREGSTTLGKEVQLCRAYLEILKFRMEDRLRYTVTIPQGLMSAQFPPMMLQSLVENSIKHGLEPKPEGGAVTISADIVDGRLRVTVADSGLGFAAASRPGTGVGLANVRERLSALYGGRARLVDRSQRSDRNHRHDRCAVQLRGECTAHSGCATSLTHNARMTRAIIADDERLMREQLRARLSEVWPDLQVVAEAKNGEEAVAAVRELAPDLAFLDIRMPGMTGIEAARAIGDACHVVFITAYNEYAVEAFEHGAVDYVLKPAERERLELTVARLKKTARATTERSARPADTAGAEARRSFGRCNRPVRPRPAAVDPGERRPATETDPGRRRAVLSRPMRSTRAYRPSRWRR